MKRLQMMKMRAGMVNLACNQEASEGWRAIRSLQQGGHQRGGQEQVSHRWARQRERSGHWRMRLGLGAGNTDGIIEGSCGHCSALVDTWEWEKGGWCHPYNISPSKKEEWTLDSACSSHESFPPMGPPKPSVQPQNESIIEKTHYFSFFSHRI